MLIHCLKFELILTANIEPRPPVVEMVGNLECYLIGGDAEGYGVNTDP